MDVDAWGSKATGVLMDDSLALWTDLECTDLKMWELQTSLYRYAARTEANVPENVSLGQIEGLKRQQTDGHLGDHLLTTVKKSEVGIGYSEGSILSKEYRNRGIFFSCSASYSLIPRFLRI